jgi:two-component system response regulator MprA
MANVLVVDDDPRLLAMLRRTLSYEGFRVSTAKDGLEALDCVFENHPDVIVLDWMIPKLDGVGVLRALRDQDDETPILMLTARDAVHYRVEGLERGADDYLVKPFESVELVARVKALLRRAGLGEEDKPLTYADLSFNPVTREVRRGPRSVGLTPTEFDLLGYFMRHANQVLERGQILANVWGYHFVGDDNIIEVYVGYLRKKLEAGGEARLIQTVRGVGYVLREDG